MSLCLLHVGCEPLEELYSVLEGISMSQHYPVPWLLVPEGNTGEPGRSQDRAKSAQIWVRELQGEGECGGARRAGCSHLSLSSGEWVCQRLASVPVSPVRLFPVFMLMGYYCLSTSTAQS